MPNPEPSALSEMWLEWIVLKWGHGIHNVHPRIQMRENNETKEHFLFHSTKQ